MENPKRRTKLETHVIPRIAEIEAWAKVGVPDEQIAKNLGVGYSTFRKYVKEAPELEKAVKNAKEAADAAVENMAFKRATGYTVRVKKFFKLRDVEYKDGKRVKETERLEEREEEQYIPPTDPSIDRWLMNRRKDRWQAIRNIKLEAAVAALSYEEYLQKLAGQRAVDGHEKVYRDVSENQDER